MVAVESYNYFDFDFSKETLVTSPRRIFAITFQLRQCLREGKETLVTSPIK